MPKIIQQIVSESILFELSIGKLSCIPIDISLLFSFKLSNGWLFEVSFNLACNTLAPTNSVSKWPFMYMSNRLAIRVVIEQSLVVLDRASVRCGSILAKVEAHLDLIGSGLDVADNRESRMSTNFYPFCFR